MPNTLYEVKQPYEANKPNRLILHIIILYMDFI